MVNKRSFLALILVTTLAGSASVSLAADGSATHRGAKSPIATNSSAQLSGPMTALCFVGDRLLNVFRTMRGIGSANLPAPGTVYQTHGIQDGPDGVDPLGVKDSGKRSEGPVPASTRVP